MPRGTDLSDFNFEKKVWHTICNWDSFQKPNSIFKTRTSNYKKKSDVTVGNVLKNIIKKI